MNIRTGHPLLADELEGKALELAVHPSGPGTFSQPRGGSCAGHAKGFTPKHQKRPESHPRAVSPSSLPVRAHTLFSFKLSTWLIWKAPHLTPRPLPMVWIGFPTPCVELMRSHSHGEPEHFPPSLPPPPTPLGELLYALFLVS